MDILDRIVATINCSPLDVIFPYLIPDNSSCLRNFINRMLGLFLIYFKNGPLNEGRVELQRSYED